MTAKDKAKELIDKMKLATDEFGYININKERHKQCALIAVDDIIRVCPYFDSKIRETDDQLSAFDFQFVSYWQEVKQEIERL